LDLEKYQGLSVLRPFFARFFPKIFIWYIALPYQVTDHVGIGYGPLIFHELRKNIRNYQFTTLFFLSAYQYSFDIWYIALSYHDTDQVRIWLRSIDFL
jgi:hypothetical protein